MIARKLVGSVAALSLLALSVGADARACRDTNGRFIHCPVPAAPPASLPSSAPSSPADTPGYYRAASGHEVHRPEHADSRPAGATAQCRDGSWSFSESHRGTCSHHGGVGSWM